MPEFELLKGLESESLHIFLKAWKVLEFSPNETIFREGDESDSLYLIAEGTCDLSAQSGFKLSLSEGDCFGEIGILLRRPRTASASARTRMRCVQLRMADLTPLFEKHPGVQKNFREFLCLRLFSHLLDAHSLLKKLSYVERCQLFRQFEIREFDSGADIISPGRSHHPLYFVLEGFVEVETKERDTIRIGPGNFFGEMHFVTDRPSDAFVRATQRVRTLVLREESFSSFKRTYAPLLEWLRNLSVARELQCLLEGGPQHP